EFAERPKQRSNRPLMRMMRGRPVWVDCCLTTRTVGFAKVAALSQTGISHERLFEFRRLK
ncbi:hypothetical protein, partial [Caballeronia telluris]|uniref:hypothetical protein n=1 Tax=Caballeronia telluris TaxID=326475 RepID=UPI001F2B0C68